MNMGIDASVITCCCCSATQPSMKYPTRTREGVSGEPKGQVGVRGQGVQCIQPQRGWYIYKRWLPARVG